MLRRVSFLISVLMLVNIAAGSAATGASPGASAAKPQDGGPSVGLQLVAGGFTSPVALAQPNDGSGRLFIVDQVGKVWILMPDGQLSAQPFLDISSRLVTLQPFYDERGLLGLAFHPGYAANGRFFVYYSAPLRAGAPAGYDHTNVVSEFHVSGDPQVADASSERMLLQVDQPQFNHNAGTLAFGPDDGMLYISIGDGGGANDVGLGHVEDWYADNAGGNAQDVEQNLNGNILRIDVDSGDPYGIPADNPFVGRAGLDEVWAYGFRNPYRFSFDQGAGHSLFVGDAGQGLWEEASIAVKGGNYGWNVKEGTHCFDAEDSTVVPPFCPSVVGAGHPDAGAPLIDPVIEYANAGNPNPGHELQVGRVIVGGYVYRGATLRQFDGSYIFGDWSRSFTEPQGVLMVAQPRQTGLWHILTLKIQDQPNGELGHFVLGFGQDFSGEVYVLTTNMVGPTGATGQVYKLIQPGNR